MLWEMNVEYVDMMPFGHGWSVASQHDSRKEASLTSEARSCLSPSQHGLVHDALECQRTHGSLSLTERP